MAILNTVQIQAIREIMDEMLDDWSKPCKIWYRPILEDCEACLNMVDDGLGVGGLFGGPMANLCPFCNGSGKREKEVTDTINLEIDYTNKFNRNNWINLEEVKRPYEIINVKGYLTELPKLQKSIEVQVNIPAFPHTDSRYVLMGDADSSFAVVQERYFLATLKRQ